MNQPTMSVMTGGLCTINMSADAVYSQPILILKQQCCHCGELTSPSDKLQKPCPVTVNHRENGLYSIEHIFNSVSSWMTLSCLSSSPEWKLVSTDGVGMCDCCEPDYYDGGMGSSLCTWRRAMGKYILHVGEL